MKFKTIYIKLRFPIFNILLFLIDCIKFIFILAWHGFKFVVMLIFNIIRFPILYAVYILAHIIIGFSYCYDLLFKVELFGKMTSIKFHNKYRVKLV